MIHRIGDSGHCISEFMHEKCTVWIDLDNTPHVPFFRPIIRELEARGHHVCVSARDAFQVCQLADLLQVGYEKIGRHYGKNRMRKVYGVIWRALQLFPFVLRSRPVLALSHGSRSQLLLANTLGIPTVMIMDYEHARTPWMLRPKWEIVPAALRDQQLQCRYAKNILTYAGIKEDVYVGSFRADDGLPSHLRLDNARIIVTARPPATEAHYHKKESEALFAAFMDIACQRNDVQLILMPRTKAQEQSFRRAWPDAFARNSVIVPAGALDGLSLLYHSDLVVSGGGTMNREGAALGLPVYSLFRGPLGAVDRQLELDGRLTRIENRQQLEDRMLFKRRPRNQSPAGNPRTALVEIMSHLEMIMAREHLPSGKFQSRRSAAS